MNSLILALDWTANINHIGFFVAKAKGFYQANGIDLTIIDPSQDNYKVTPAKKVELGEADFALCPMESIISYQTKTKPFNLKAIAAIFREDLSAIVCKEGSVHSPKDLDGKSYASYRARYEDQIVKQMIINDGGEGNLQIVYPEKLGIWDTILADNYEATWIFMNWEGVQAENENIPLSYFQMKDYNIPYAYSPVIVTNGSKITSDKSHYKNFLTATKQGFLYAKNNPKEAVEILAALIPEKDKNIDLTKSLAYSSKYFGNENEWGIMEESSISEFLEWIYTHQLETIKLSTRDLIDNSLL